MTQRRFHFRPQPTRPTRRALLWSALAYCVFDGPAAGAEPTPAFRILIHPDNPATNLSRDFVTDLFLKRATRWSDGEAAHPVDQGSDTAVRARFSEAVLRRSVAAVKRYWQQRIFSGRDLPPPEFESDEAVVSYVLKHRGAIGYVSPGCKLERAKAVSVE
jgi:ABC-type phosphate transport system substrate-binding protein